ncbi:TIGR02099 family protein, partial [Pseudomonas syringae]
VGTQWRLGSLGGRWGRGAPVLRANDVRVGRGTRALRLVRVRVVPDLWESLLARDVRIAHLEVDGLQFSLRQDKDGAWSVQGLPVHNDSPYDPEQVLRQMQMVAHLSLLDSQVTVHPFDAAPPTLPSLNLSLCPGASPPRLYSLRTL